MKNIIVVTVLASSFLSLFVHAGSELEEKIQVLKVLKKNTETVACNTNFEESQSLEPFLKNTYAIQRDDYEATYYVLWVGDIGCAGGSGTTSWHISQVSRSNYAGFLVQNHTALGSDPSLKFNFRLISDLQKINANKLVLTSADYDEKDANCCPSLNYEYTLEREDDYADWKQTGQKFLGKQQ